MRVLVCVKADKGDLSPFDESALECALRLGADETVLLSMGPPGTANTLRGLLRLGADRFVLLSDPSFAGSDTLATAYILSLAVRRLAPDLVLCGRQSMSGDTAQVGPELAVLLDMPLIPYAMSLEVSNGMLCCETRKGIKTEKLPALAAVERIHTLRLPRAFGRSGGVLSGKTSLHEVWDAAFLGADSGRCGLAGSPTRVVKTFENRRGLRRCRFIKAAEVPALVENRRGEKRQKTALSPARRRLPRAWVVGDSGLAEIAGSIAEDVKIIDRDTPRRTAELIKIHDPAVVLWPADWWGRQAAPRTAVLLGAGLCADCTALETDGEHLFFYRPALGGNLMGKIRCLTRPAMATVRLTEVSGEDLIVSMGLGMRGFEGHMVSCAKRLGAGIGASRSAVDAGMAPYEDQVGLTGRMVSPGVYLSLGISGAVAHTCAIEGAHCIVAVNTDENARIFKYADYGVVGSGEEVLSFL